MGHSRLEDCEIDPLPQYGSHAFLPYLDTPSNSSFTPSTSSTSPESISSSSTDVPPFTLHNTSSWTYSGPLLPSTTSLLPPSFHNWTKATVSHPAAFLNRLLPVLSFLDTFLRSAGAHYYWLTIRASKANHDYDMTRWHTDDIFFDYDGEKDRVAFDQHTEKGDKNKNHGRKNRYWKLATTLLGPGTLFLKDGARARDIQRSAKTAECAKRGEHTCTQFRCLGCLDAVEAVRKTLAQEFAHETVESPQFGEIALFRLGDEEGAVHSEPACHEDRIFVNVVPGTEDELRGLMRRWGLGFPRAWCFGVPVGFDDVGVVETNKEEEDIDVEMATEKEGVLDSPVEKERDHDVVQRPTPAFTTTMSTNLRDEYTEWLHRKGFRASKIFGPMSMMGS